VKEQVGAAVGIHVLEMPRAVLLGAIADEADRRQIDGCRVEGVRRQDRDGDDTVRLQRDDIVGLAGLDVDSDFDLARGAEEARQREVADTRLKSAVPPATTTLPSGCAAMSQALLIGLPTFAVALPPLPKLGSRSPAAAAAEAGTAKSIRIRGWRSCSCGEVLAVS
jgi:hypothetical protein